MSMNKIFLLHLILFITLQRSSHSVHSFLFNRNDIHGILTYRIGFQISTHVIHIHKLKEVVSGNAQI